MCVCVCVFMYIVHTIIKTRQQKLFFHILHDDFDGVQAIVKGGRLHEVIYEEAIRRSRDDFERFAMKIFRPRNPQGGAPQGVDEEEDSHAHGLGP